MASIAWAHSSCAAMSGAELTYPFGNDTSVYKVDGRMFAAIGRAEGGIDRITLKCAPERAAILVGEHQHITPGYHMNKRHWITVDLDGSVPRPLVEDLVDDSYFLVRGKSHR